MMGTDLVWEMVKYMECVYQRAIRFSSSKKTEIRIEFRFPFFKNEKHRKKQKLDAL